MPAGCAIRKHVAAPRAPRARCRARRLAKRLPMRLLIALPLCLASFAAEAVVCKYLDRDGRVIYSDVNVPGAKRLSCLPPLIPAPATEPGAPRPTAKYDPATAPPAAIETRNGVRRQALEDELAAAQKALAGAKAALAEAEQTPEVYRKGGRIYRDVAKYEEKIRRLNEDIAQHEKNIAVLTRELESAR